MKSPSDNRIALICLSVIAVITVVGMVILFIKGQPGSALGLSTIVVGITSGLLGYLDPKSGVQQTQITNTASDPVPVTDKGDS